MELGAFGVLDAVREPWTSLSFEGNVVGRVPVSSGKDSGVSLLEDFYVVIKCRNHFVSSGNGQSPAWTKIVLHIYNYKHVRLAYAKVFFQTDFTLTI
jgi:hypothetical protein